jgi:hypothetical protein
MSYVPPPPSAPYGGRPPGLSRAVKITLGALIGAVALPVVTFLGLLVGSRMDVIGLVWLAPVVVLLAGVGLLVDAGTRPWGTGILIGFFGMLIVGAGACVVLLAGLSGNLG